MSKKRIIVVDDKSVELQVNKMIIESCGCEAIDALGGVNGANIIKENIENVDCIILDWMMPDLDAMEILEELHPLIKQHSVPVFILSGHTIDLTPEQKQGFGIVECLTKPCNIQTLQQAIQMHLGS